MKGRVLTVGEWRFLTAHHRGDVLPLVKKIIEGNEDWILITIRPLHEKTSDPL